MCIYRRLNMFSDLKFKWFFNILNCDVNEDKKQYMIVRLSDWSSWNAICMSKQKLGVMFMK